MLFIKCFCNWVIFLVLFVSLLTHKSLGNRHNGRKSHHRRRDSTRNKHHSNKNNLDIRVPAALTNNISLSSSFSFATTHNMTSMSTTKDFIEKVATEKLSTSLHTGTSKSTPATTMLSSVTNMINDTKQSTLTITQSTVSFINTNKNEPKTTELPVQDNKMDKHKRGRFKVTSIKPGKVRGRVIEVEPEKKVYAYRGIPYGETPTGKNRFKQPKPIQPWKNSVKDALEYPNSCYQWTDKSFDESYRKDFYGTMMWNTNTKMSEDCLYLNVWTPANPKKSKDLKLAVMVWIYGGGFYSGTSSLAVYNGAWLASKQKVVVVSMNYRVAGLGFLALDDKEIPGNAGLFDQRLALQWVKDNIHSFGGNPENVTLFGESAGAASIALHMMSKKSKGLFNNVILQSASSLSPWVILDKKETQRRAYKLAMALNCTNSSQGFNKIDEKEKQQIFSCLQSVGPLTLVDTEMYLESYGIARFPNAAVIDNNFLDISPFDSDSPSYWNTDVNVLAGFNANEGNYFIVYSSIVSYDLNTSNYIGNDMFEKGIKEALRSMNGTDKSTDETIDLLTKSSHFVYTGGYEPVQLNTRSGEKKKKLFVPKGKQFSLHNKQQRRKNGRLRAEVFYRERLDDLVGDINFVCPTIDFLDKYNEQLKSQKKAKSGKKTYLYKFVHRSSQNPWPEWMGVMHGYEIEFIFGLPFNRSLGYTEEERDISEMIMRMWANFAKYGNPNRRNQPNMWPPYNETTKTVFSIGNPSEESKQSKFSLYSNPHVNLLTHCAFWEEHFPTLHQKLDAIQAPPSCPAIQKVKNGGYSPCASLSGFFILLLAVVISINNF